jgi:hypothetical protein
MAFKRPEKAQGGVSLLGATTLSKRGTGLHGLPRGFLVPYPRTTAPYSGGIDL